MTIFVVPDLHGRTAWKASAQHQGGPVKTDSELAAAVRRQRYFRDLLYRGQAEQTHSATHQATGLVVKVRPDLIIDSPQRRRRTLVDFKNTSCRDLEQSLRTVEQYDYDRQAVLYADTLTANRVVLIAVQKRASKGQEPAVWVYELSPAQLQAGRRKYIKLLRSQAERPSTLKLYA